MKQLHLLPQFKSKDKRWECWHCRVGEHAPAQPKDPLLPFCSTQALKGLEDPHWWEHLLCLVYWFPTLCILEISSQSHPEIMLYQLSRHSLAQSGWHIKLNWPCYCDRLLVLLQGIPELIPQLRQQTECLGKTEAQASEKMLPHQDGKIPNDWSLLNRLMRVLSSTGPV